MAKGLLGSAAATTGPVVVYTVPSGISHAVVHITIDSDGGSNMTNCFVSVSGMVVLRGNGSTYSSALNAVVWGSNAVSMMLSPGDVVRVSTGFGGPNCYCTVSGYEVA